MALPPLAEEVRFPSFVWDSSMIAFGLAVITTVAGAMLAALREEKVGKRAIRLGSRSTIVDLPLCSTKIGLRPISAMVHQSLTCRF